MHMHHHHFTVLYTQYLLLYARAPPLHCVVHTIPSALCTCTITTSLCCTHNTFCFMHVHHHHFIVLYTQYLLLYARAPSPLHCVVHTIPSALCMCTTTTSLCCAHNTFCCMYMHHCHFTVFYAHICFMHAHHHHFTVLYTQHLPLYVSAPPPPLHCAVHTIPSTLCAPSPPLHCATPGTFYFMRVHHCHFLAEHIHL